MFRQYYTVVLQSYIPWPSVGRISKWSSGRKQETMSKIASMDIARAVCQLFCITARVLHARTWRGGTAAPGLGTLGGNLIQNFPRQAHTIKYLMKGNVYKNCLIYSTYLLISNWNRGNVLACHISSFFCINGLTRHGNVF